MAPLEGRNAGWIINALEIAFEQHGAPKHIISDQAGVFTGGVFAELLRRWNVKPRLGAIGKHGAIAVTERVIKTLKYEWLEHAAIIKGFDHLVLLCAEFETWHNNWRPHMTLNGLRPDDVYYSRKTEKPNHENSTLQHRASPIPGNTDYTVPPQERSVVSFLASPGVAAQTPPARMLHADCRLASFDWKLMVATTCSLHTCPTCHVFNERLARSQRVRGGPIPA